MEKEWEERIELREREREREMGQWGCCVQVGGEEEEKTKRKERKKGRDGSVVQV